MSDLFYIAIFIFLANFIFWIVYSKTFVEQIKVNDGKTNKIKNKVKKFLILINGVCRK